MKKQVVALFSSVMICGSLMSGIAMASPANSDSSVIQKIEPVITYENDAVKSRIDPTILDKVKSDNPDAKHIEFLESQQPNQFLSYLQDNSFITPMSILYSYEVNSLVDLYYQSACYPTEYIIEVSKGMTKTLGYNYSSSRTTTWGIGVDASIKEVVNLKGTYNTSGTVTSTYLASTTFSGPPEASNYSLRTYYNLVNDEAYSYTATQTNKLTGSTTKYSGNVGIPRYTPYFVER